MTSAGHPRSDDGAEFVFLTLALLAGFCMVFITGPFQAPDEMNHFYRAYQISEGVLCGTRVEKDAGGSLPNSVSKAPAVVDGVRFNAENKVHVPSVNRALRKPWKPIRKTRRSFVAFPNTVRVSPIGYLPQVVGIAVARYFGVSVLGMMYAARISNVLVWIALTFVAIRMAPVFKKVFMLVALMPMTIFLAASVSADTMINACSMLLLALVLKARQEEKPRSAAYLLSITLLCVAISTLKLVYLPLVFLIFIIAPDRFGGTRRRAAWCGAILGASILLAFLWWREIGRVYVSLNHSNIQQQLSFIAVNPLTIPTILANTIRVIGRDYLLSFIGILGWLDTFLPSWIYVTYIPALIATALFDRGQRAATCSFGMKAYAFSVCCISMLLIATAQYLMWNKPGAELVEGVFGRYSIPLAVPALLVFHNRLLPRIENRIFTAAVTAYSALVLFFTCLTIFTRYYG